MDGPAVHNWAHSRLPVPSRTPAHERTAAHPSPSHLPTCLQGFDNVNNILSSNGAYAPGLLIQIVVMKVIATSICRGSGLQVGAGGWVGGWCPGLVVRAGGQGWV